MSGLVTVIIPVYNVEKFLGICIESICNQTYKNIEIILVDDGSTDSSGSICDEYEKKDLRITTIHKKNGGLSSARNTGLDRAKGNYISFVDSDDIIAMDMIEVLVTQLNKNGSDIAICNKTTELCEIELGNKFIAENLERAQALKEMIIGFKFASHACDKIYKYSCFENIRYPLGKYYEDLYTTYKVVENANLITYCDINKYFYRLNADGITKRPYSSRDLDMIYGMLEIKEYFLLNYTELVKYVNMSIVKACTALLRKMITTNNHMKSDIRFLKSKIRKNILIFLKSSYPFENKLFALITIINFSLARVIYIFMKGDKNDT